MILGGCSCSTQMRFLGGYVTGYCTLAQAEAIATILSGYNMTTIPWGKTLVLNFGESGPDYTSALYTSDAPGHATSLGIIANWISPMPSAAFSFFGNGAHYCCGAIGAFSFVRGQQALTLGATWNIQTPPWCWLYGAVAIPLDSPGYGPSYGPPISNGPGSLSCVDGSSRDRLRVGRSNPIQLD